MTLRTKANRPTRENLSPLERLELSQLKLVGIIWDTKDPRAMVEDNAGLGYVIKIGTPIGSHDGKVKAIHQAEVVVEEFYSDDYGARKRREVGMKLLTD
jgi:type IV pilus assembly protein PilP